MRSALLLIFLTAPAFGQLFHAGIKGGVPLSDFIDAARNNQTVFNSNTKRYIIGPQVELRLPAGISIELDALYRRMNYTGSSLGVDVLTQSRTTGNAWEFPLMLKYRLHAPLVRPFVGAGIAWDTLSGLKQDVTRTVVSLRNTTTNSTSNPPELDKNTTKGFVMGIGIDVHAILVHVSPEIRYTRWGSQHFRDAANLLRSNQNQAEFLIGITF